MAANIPKHLRRAQPLITAVSRLPNLLRKARWSTVVHSGPARPHTALLASILIGLPVIIIAALFLHTPRNAPSDPSTRPTAPTAPTEPNPVAPPPAAPVPPSGAVEHDDASTASHTPILQTWPSTIPDEVFTRMRVQTFDSADDIKELQDGLKRFGLLTGPSTGTLDKPTTKALHLLHIVTDDPTSNTAEAIAALKVAEARATLHLDVLHTFPFGDRVPSWLLASLDDDTPKTIAAATARHLAAHETVFSVPLTAPGLILRAQLFPDAGQLPQQPGCFDFSAFFERPPLSFHVISRACRIASDPVWALADK